MLGNGARFIVYRQTGKGPVMLTESNAANAVAFSVARHHAKAHGVVFLLDTVTGRCETVNGKGEYSIVSR